MSATIKATARNSTSPELDGAVASFFAWWTAKTRKQFKERAKRQPTLAQLKGEYSAIGIEQFRAPWKSVSKVVVEAVDSQLRKPRSQWDSDDHRLVETVVGSVFDKMREDLERKRGRPAKPKTTRSQRPLGIMARAMGEIGQEQVESPRSLERIRRQSLLFFAAGAKLGMTMGSGTVEEAIRIARSDRVSPKTMGLARSNAKAAREFIELYKLDRSTSGAYEAYLSRETKAIERILRKKLEE